MYSDARDDLPYCGDSFRVRHRIESYQPRGDILDYVGIASDRLRIELDQSDRPPHFRQARLSATHLGLDPASIGLGAWAVDHRVGIELQQPLEACLRLDHFALYRGVCAFRGGDDRRAHLEIGAQVFALQVRVGQVLAQMLDDHHLNPVQTIATVV